MRYTAILRYLFSFPVLTTASTDQIFLNTTIPALNPQLTNTIPNGAGPVLYYNGSGPLPSIDTLSPQPEPLAPLSNAEFQANIFTEILTIAGQKTGQSLVQYQPSATCPDCLALMQIFHVVALSRPANDITEILIGICEIFQLGQFLRIASSCESLFSGVGDFGPYWAQLLAKISMATGDMQAFCHYEFLKACDLPEVVTIDESEWFSPKPENKTTAPEPSGETFDVLHISDWHMDPRFDIGSEANCTDVLCCRPNAVNEVLGTNSSYPSLPASRFGAYLCDSPPDLVLSAFESIRRFRNLSNIGFTIFTGDIVSNDPFDELSHDLITYEEETAFATFKAQLGDIPLFATLGNHDTHPSDFRTPNSFTNNNASANIFSWNYDLISSLWLQNNWIDTAAANQASKHYGAYAYTTPHGLKIISINSDFWHTANIFNFANFSNPDPSGILKFLISELEISEKADQRVWIIGHIPSGADVAIPNPSALFHAIVRRFSPATIAGVFFGHSHMDEIEVYYDLLPQNSSRLNVSKIDYSKPVNMAFIGPSIVPLSAYNAGWTVYQIDAKTFSVVNGQTYFANISNSLVWDTPVWEFEYNKREIYDPKGKWPKNAPLNATFWDGVTKEMEGNLSLMQTYNFLKMKSSVLTPVCAGQSCVDKMVCILRSGDGAARGLCPS